MLPSLFPSFSMSSALQLSSTSSERESMALIKRAAATRVDELLQKWTNLSRAGVNADLISDGDSVKSPSTSLSMMTTGVPVRRTSSTTAQADDLERLKERRRSQQPSVENEEKNTIHGRPREATVQQEGQF